MDRLRIPFTCEAPNVDEDSVKLQDRDPLATVQELANQKARAVYERHPKSVVVGCDQAVVLDKRFFDKPGSIEAAIKQLRQMRGQEHRLITAVAIAHSGGMVEFTDTTRLTMRNLTNGEIARYVHADRPLDCAGSYKIESLGISLFERIDSHDHTAIIGLPLLQLCRELRKLGVPLP